MAYLLVWLALVWFCAGMALTALVRHRGLGVAIISNPGTREERLQRVQRLWWFYRGVLRTLQFGWILPLLLALNLFLYR